MIKVKIIAMGKLKEQYLLDAVKEYAKRLSAYCKLEITELNPARLPENPSAAQIADALKKEETAITDKIPSGAFVTALCIEGKMLTSEEFSEKITDKINDGTGTFVFIIGSSYGISDAVKNKADFKLSFSRMTFPHQMARVILCEQLYRAFKISQGSAYHK